MRATFVKITIGKDEAILKYNDYYSWLRLLSIYIYIYRALESAMSNSSGVDI